MASSNKVEEKDFGLKKFFQRLKVFDGLEVVVGIPKEAGSQEREGGTTLAEIAATHEFGAGNIPQRSFLRATFDIHEKKYASILEKATAKVLKNANPKQALFVLGETARRDVVTRINEGIPPPNAPLTIARKGSSLPLVDTGMLRNSITAVVQEETRE